MRYLLLIFSLLLATVCKAQKTDLQEYGLKGNVKMLRETSGDTGNRCHKKVVCFNEWGSITSLDDSFHSLTEKVTKEYDSKNRLSIFTQMTYYTAPGWSGRTDTLVEKYTYDDNGLSDIFSEQRGHRSWSYITKMIRNERGPVMEERHYLEVDTGLKENGKNIFVYDNNDSLLGTDILYIGADKPVPKSRNIYNAQGLLLESLDYGGKKKPAYVRYKYDAQKRIIEEQVKSYAWVYTYDEQGRISEIHQTSKRKRANKHTKYRYSDIDTHGNYLKWSIDDKTYTRQIEYYP